MEVKKRKTLPIIGRGIFVICVAIAVIFVPYLVGSIVDKWLDVGEIAMHWSWMIGAISVVVMMALVYFVLRILLMITAVIKWIIGD